MPTPDLVEALQFASEIRHQFLPVGSASWTVSRLRHEGSQSPWFVTCTTGLEGAYHRPVLPLALRDTSYAALSVLPDNYSAHLEDERLF